MPRLNYPLKTYVKAVETLTIRKGFDRVRSVNNGGSIVRFELFCSNEVAPTSIWIVHFEHSKAKRIISREDYKKAALRLNSTLEEFISVLEEVS